MVVGKLPSSLGTTVLVLEKADDEAPCMLRNCRPSHIQQASAVKHQFVSASLILLAWIGFLNDLCTTILCNMILILRNDSLLRSRICMLTLSSLFPAFSS